MGITHSVLTVYSAISECWSQSAKSLRKQAWEYHATKSDKALSLSVHEHYKSENTFGLKYLN